MGIPANDNNEGISAAQKFEESQIIDEGVNRARARRHNQDLMSSNKGAHSLVIEHLQPIMDAIVNEMETCENMRGTTARWVDEVKKVSLLDVAYLAYMSCLDGNDKEWGINTLRINLGKAFVGLAFEAALVSHSREGWKLAQQLEQNVQSRTRFDHRQDYVMHVAKKHGFDTETWEAKEGVRIHEVGAALVTCVEKAVGSDTSSPRIFKRVFDYKDEEAKFGQWYLVLTKEAEALLEQELLNTDYLSPYFSPIIKPPRPWNSDQIGPYSSPSLNYAVKPIKHASPAQAVQLDKAMRDGSMEDALHALNTLQEVPYEVNMFVVDAVDWVRKRGLARKVKKYPNPKKCPVPKFAFNEDKTIPGALLWDKVNGDWDKLEEKDQTDFMRDRMRAGAANRQANANSSRVRRVIKLARLMDSKFYEDPDTGKKEKLPFYMPHNWDRRGRVYHVSDFGHHDRDFLRAMFLMHNKTEVTEEAAHWLMLQLANTYGKDKLSYEERLDWVADNAQMLYDCAFDFKAKDAFEFWRQASEPFQFLAACNDWMQYCQARAEEKPYFSGLPIALDATQSGVQHYAAASLNLDDGLLVNLVNNEHGRPNDLYKACLEVAEVMILEDLEEKRFEAAGDPVNDNDRLALAEHQKLMKQLKTKDYKLLKQMKKKRDAAKRAWKKTESSRKLKRDLDILSAEQIQRYTEIDRDGNEVIGLNRSIVKRNVMTWAYSSRKYGFARQLRKDWLDEMAKEVRFGERDEHPFGEDEGFAASSYLAEINEEAIGKVVKSALEGMEFFQTLAAIMARRNLHVSYRTPILNFPVHQYYRTENKKGSAGRHKVYMFNHELGVTERDKKMTFIEYTDTVDPDKSVSAIAPNVIHSMDSTMLMLAVLECEKRGFTDLMVVHDSFATTAGNAQAMQKAVKEAFVRLYDGYCLYSDLLEQVKAQHPDPDNIETQREIDELSAKIDKATGPTKANLKKQLKAKEKLIVDWPEIPGKGELNIHDVRDSDYFVT